MTLDSKEVLSCLSLLASDKRIRVLDRQSCRFISQYTRVCIERDI